MLRFATLGALGLGACAAGQAESQQQGPILLVDAAAHATVGPTVADVETRQVDVSEIIPLCLGFVTLLVASWILWMCLRLRNGAREGDRLQIAVACVACGTSSVSMHVLNKVIVQMLDAPMLVAGVQMAIAVVLTGSMAGAELFKAPPRQLLYWLAVPMFFAGVLCTGACTYRQLSLSFLTIIRNLAPLAALAAEMALLPKEHRPLIDRKVLLALVLILFGGIVYCGGIPSVPLLGIGLGLLNLALALSDRLVQRHLLTGACSDLPSSVCMVINNFVGIVPTLLMAQASGQFQSALQPENKATWLNPTVQILLVASGFVGIGTGFFGLECQRAISVTSFLVLQNISKCAVVAVGVFVFGDPSASPLAVLGMLTNLGGSFMYSWAQAQAQVSRPAHPWKGAAADEAKGASKEGKEGTDEELSHGCSTEWSSEESDHVTIAR